MEKNPFSLYDFLGYVFPGAFAIMALYYFSIIGYLEFENPMTIDEVKNLVQRKLLGAETVMSYSVFLVAAYVVGHIVAYLSSITVERFLIWWYGYPSDFLLREQRMDFYFFKEAQKMYKEKDKCWKWTLLRTYFLRLIVLMFLFPITLSSLLVRIFGGDSFFVKKLDDFLINSIYQKRHLLLNGLKLPDVNKYGSVDFHRVIYHYEYEHCEAHRKKMDNYVALYGFLRAITMLLNVIFMYVFISPFIFHEVSFGMYYYISVISLLILTYLSFMSFFKFYRRFTLEAFMCLVIE